MTFINGESQFGLIKNADFTNGNTNWTWGSINEADKLFHNPCLEVTGGGGSTITGELIPVDTTKTYQLICYCRTLETGSADNALAGGHIGFACYDENQTFIDLRNCKGLGDTTLTREATPGDTSIYVANASAWSTNATDHQRGFMLFGGDYPYSGGYSRYTVTSNFYPNTGLTNLGGGEWRIDLSSTLPTWSNALSGSVYPVGTYVSNGRAGGTYSYALNNPNFPLTWTRYATPPFTGESRNSTYPFRYGTKYIRYMFLRNYNRRTEPVQDHRWAVTNFFFAECKNGIDYRDIFREV